MRGLRNPFFIFIIVTNIVIGTSTLTRGHEWGDDFASYIMQAQSILSGRTSEFVERNTFTIFKSSAQIGPVAYPWGYPLILTPAILLKGIHPLALKLPGLFFFIGFLIFVYLLIQNRLNSTESLLLISLLAFNPILVKFLDQILSDIPFLFFIYVALFLAIRLKPDQDPRKHVFLAVVMFLAASIRTTGIILLASYLVYQTICFYVERTERKAILTNSVLSVLTFGLLLIIFILIFPNGQGSYLDQLNGLTFATLQKNISGYLFLFSSFFGTEPVWTYIYYMLVVFFLFGVFIRRNTDQPLVIFFALYLAAMIIWPEWQGIRFIFPLLPLFLYFSFQGISFVINKLSGDFRLYTKTLSYGFWLVIIGIFIFNSGTHAYINMMDNRKINGPFDPYSTDMYNYIKAETPTDSVIVFFKPRAMRLFTNRNSVMILECSQLPIGDYDVIHKTWEFSQILPDEIQKCNLPLKNVFENRRFIVYKILK